MQWTVGKQQKYLCDVENRKEEGRQRKNHLEWESVFWNNEPSWNIITENTAEIQIELQWFIQLLPEQEQSSFE